MGSGLEARKVQAHFWAAPGHGVLEAHRCVTHENTVQDMILDTVLNGVLVPLRC